MNRIDENRIFIPLAVAVLTVSDPRMSSRMTAPGMF